MLQNVQYGTSCKIFINHLDEDLKDHLVIIIEFTFSICIVVYLFSFGVLVKLQTALRFLCLLENRHEQKKFYFRDVHLSVLRRALREFLQIW